MSTLPKTEKHPGKMALHLALKSQANQQNPRKIVLGSEIQAEQTWEAMEAAEAAGDTPEVLLASAAEVNPEQWLAERRKEVAGFFDAEWTEAQLVGTWPEKPSENADFLIDDEWAEEAFVAQISAEDSWQLPAHLAFGGWNECPVAEVQCALWKRWQETYDAHIVAVCGDVVQARVNNPPKTQEAAMKLAWEQYLYCNDIVDQGTGTLSELAALLLNGDVWYFWWD